MSTKLSLEEFPVRLVWRTDVHMADVPPVSRVDDWTETVCDKLRQVGKLAWEIKAQAVLDGGDFFHIKSPVRTSHRTLRTVVAIHRDNYSCPVYANVGNHDCVYSDIRWLPQQPLGVLFETGAFQRLYGDHEALFEADGVKVRVVGVPYHGTSYDLSKLDVKKGEEDYLVVVAHLLASDTGSTSLFESEDVVSYSHLRGLEADVFCFGHWHKDQGITEISPGKWVVNVGSLTRGALSQDHLERIPACAILAFGPGGVQVERHDLKVSPSAEVFDLQGRVRMETSTMVIDSFVEKMRTTLKVDGRKSLEDSVRETKGIPSSVRERTLLYLERAS